MRAKPPARPEPNHQSLNPTAETPTLTPSTGTGGDSFPDPAKLLAAALVAKLREAAKIERGAGATSQDTGWAPLMEGAADALSAALERETEVQAERDNALELCVQVQRELNVATARAEQARDEAHSAHIWFSRTFGTEYDGRDFPVKFAMAESDMERQRVMHKAALDNGQRYRAERDASAGALREARDTIRLAIAEAQLYGDDRTRGTDEHRPFYALLMRSVGGEEK